jgi:hypothetical protein
VIELPVIITTPSPVKDAKVNSSIYFISFESFHKCLKLYKSKSNRILPAEYNEKCSLPVQVRQWMRH